MVLDRFDFDKDMKIVNVLGISRLAGYMAKGRMIKRAVGQGIGLHSQEEVMSILREDLLALSTYLGLHF